MPNNDRTGPNGMGSQTGRGAGLCKKDSSSLSTSNGQQRKRNRRQGRGRCQGASFASQVSQDINGGAVEQQLLNQIQQLQQQLDTLRHAVNK